MKPTKLFLLFATVQLLAIGCCTAQPFSVITATKQMWNGGVVGHSGINYHLELTTKYKTLCPDTVWVNGKVYPIDFTVKSSDTKRTVDSVTHKITYTISVAESHNRFIIQADTTAGNQKPVRHFEGAAMISYMEKHKQRFFIIKSFTTLKPLNYP